MVAGQVQQPQSSMQQFQVYRPALPFRPARVFACDAPRFDACWLRPPLLAAYGARLRAYRRRARRR